MLCIIASEDILRHTNCIYFAPAISITERKFTHLRINYKTADQAILHI